MCRFLAYHGPERYLADVLIRPENSLVRQSYAAREMPGPLNGDGFGVGWYARGEDPTPCVFTSLTPAWSNRNLRRLAVHIHSPLFFAHVRAATHGTLVGEANCHPFRHGRFMWMHNGRIGGFLKIMRRMRESLRDDLYAQVRGTTDTELAFYTFVQQLDAHRAEARERLQRSPETVLRYKSQFFDLCHDPGEELLAGEPLLDRMIDHLGEFPPEALAEAMRRTLARIVDWTREADVAETSYANFAVTDGTTLVVTRWADRDHAVPPSLYWTLLGEERGEEPGVLITSEPLTDILDGWRRIPQQTMLIVRPHGNVRSAPLEPAAADALPA